MIRSPSRPAHDQLTVPPLNGLLAGAVFVMLPGQRSPLIRAKGDWRHVPSTQGNYRSAPMGGWFKHGYAFRASAAKERELWHDRATTGVGASCLAGKREFTLAVQMYIRAWVSGSPYIGQVLGVDQYNEWPTAFIRIGDATFATGTIQAGFSLASPLLTDQKCQWTSAALNTPYYCVFTWSYYRDYTARLYINGIERATKTPASGTVVYTPGSGFFAPINIGGWNSETNDTGRPFYGDIGLCEVYDRWWSPAEVAMRSVNPVQFYRGIG